MEQRKLNDTEEKKKFEWHVTDGPLFEMWLGEKKPEMSDTTVHHNSRMLIEFLTTKDPDVENLEDYNNFIIEKGIKGRNLNVYPALKYYIEYKITDAGLRERLISGLIKTHEQPPKYDNKVYLPEEKMIEILNYFRLKRHRTIALIQMITGARAGDVLSIRKGMISTEEYNGNETMKVVMIGKRKKKNVVFIHDKIVQELIMDYIRGINEQDMYKDFYFQVAGKRVGKNDFYVRQSNYGVYWAELKKAMEIAGFHNNEFSTHDFRRCFARRVWTKYKDIHILQHMLNHSNPATSLKYLETSGLKNIDYHYEMQK